MGNGRATLDVKFPQSLYFGLLSEMAGEEIKEEGALFSLVQELSEIRRKYERIESALTAAETTGYGIVMPEKEDLHLEQPSVVKQSGGWGVRLRAGAKSIHMIRTDITAEISPIVGTEQQSEDFLHTVLSKLEEEPDGIWESNFFGRSLYELVGDSLNEKLAHMPEDARQKLSETLSRIINEGSNGLLCILL